MPAPDPSRQGLSRRAFVGRVGSAGIGLTALPAVLSACGIEGEIAKRRKVAVNVHHARTAVDQLNFSNWPLYVDKSVIKQFDKRYGAHVRYVEEINDNFEFYGKVRQQLAAGQPIGRDIVTITDYMAARWVRDGYVTAMDHANVPNIRNLEDNLRHPRWDPGRNYSLPWQSGATGIGYDPRKTGRKLHSIKDLYDPAFKGRVSFLSEPYDSASLVLLGEGKDPSTATLDDLMNAIDKIEALQRSGQIRRFTGNDYTTDLTKGNLWVSIAYSGDLVQLKADNPNLEFIFPDEGAVLFTDNMLMPQKAAHPYAAETMMNFVYEPEVAAKIAIYVNYISPVKGIRQIIEKTDPEIANNPLIFPSDAQRKKLFAYPTLTATEERRMEDRMASVIGG
jgi:spermidine/putrescine transport system substrate-binding protein